MTVLIGRMEHETSLGIEGATAGMQLTHTDGMIIGKMVGNEAIWGYKWD